MERARGQWWRFVLASLGLGALIAASLWWAGARGAEETRPARAAPSSAAAVEAAPSLTATATATPSVDKAKAARAVEKAVRGSARVSVSVLDLEDGTSYTYGSSRRFVTASIVKVDILAALLLKAQDQGRALTAPEKALAVRMIESSDNNAADSLWFEIGAASGLTRANRRLGLTETTATSVSWGLTSTSARDQVRLLKALASGGGPLSARSRRYVLGLMGDVDPGQDWGVSAGDADGDGVELKNGWLPRSIDGGRWVINSIGRVEDGHRYLVAVLSDRNASMDAGVATVEAVTRAVLARLT
ncbi:serine hydrolase [Actinomadura parmotrematis]|uniref:Class A beta-lactamase-related serine hydrolase n=1 Tax=Actinomadura parmotrematis TaxID=2864039 RepID=A0ABS7G1K4_9ACTN|nr:serine hydrolase [Actinomadura parmotrematis]MBW8486386.1 class A beta-lactamase-related serine hydrolase [Actinomadura parmotrematis]